MVKLSFDSVEEVRNFVKEELKGVRRGGKDDEAAGGQPGNTAPQPLNPPVGGPATGFPGPTAFAPQGGGFPTGAPVLAPEVAALVGRIVTRVDGLITSGQQPADQILNWFRQQCGPEAANATMDQIKQVFLPKASQPTLEDIVKLIGA